MHVNPRWFDTGELACSFVKRGGLIEGYAELILSLSRRDLVVRPRVDIWVDAKGDPRGLSHRVGNLA